MECIHGEPWILEEQKICTSHGFPVVLWRLNETWGRYCVQYGGGGSYFDTEEKCWKYIHSRWPWVKKDRIHVFKGNFPRLGEVI